MGAILIDERIVAGMISDGVHAHPGAVELAYRMKGPRGMVLVTDQMAGAGMPPATIRLGDDWSPAMDGRRSSRMEHWLVRC